MSYSMQELLALGFSSRTLDGLIGEITVYANTKDSRLKRWIWECGRNMAQGNHAGIPFSLIGDAQSALIRVAFLSVTKKVAEHIWTQNPHLKVRVQRKTGEVKLFGMTVVLTSEERYGSQGDASLLEAKHFLKEVLGTRTEVFGDPDGFPQEAHQDAHHDSRAVPAELETELEQFGFQVNQEYLLSNWKLIEKVDLESKRLIVSGEIDEALRLSQLGVELSGHISKRQKVTAHRYSTGTFDFQLTSIGHSYVQNLDQPQMDLLKSLRATSANAEMLLEQCFDTAPLPF